MARKKGLKLWEERAKALLCDGDPNALIAELMDCMPLIESRRRETKESLDALENLVST